MVLLAKARGFLRGVGATAMDCEKNLELDPMRFRVFSRANVDLRERLTDCCGIVRVDFAARTTVPSTGRDTPTKLTVIEKATPKQAEQRTSPQGTSRREGRSVTAATHFVGKCRPSLPFYISSTSALRKLGPARPQAHTLSPNTMAGLRESQVDQAAENVLPPNHLSDSRSRS